MTEAAAPASINPAATSSNGDQAFGLMRVGGAMLALPVAAIREVIPGRPSYSPLPVKADGLLGAVDIRGTIIPVLDLRPVLGLPPDDQDKDRQVIVIMRWHDHLIGLTADEVCGIARIDPADLFALVSTGVSLATHSFQSGGGIATVLDPGGIAKLPNIPLVAEKPTRPRASGSTTIESILLFRQGPSHFGIDAKCVDATVPSARIERNALAAGYCLGVIDHHGYEVPVVDTRAAIGLSFDAPRLAESEVVVLRFTDEAMLGFAIDRVHDIVRIARSDILDMPMLVSDEAPLFRGMITDENGRQSLLIHVDHVRANPALRALAGFRKPKIALRRGADSVQSAQPGRGGPGASVARPHLTYNAGAEQTTPLSQINEILTYPADVAPFERHGAGMLGLFTHRGKVAPLVCLATLLGKRQTLDPSSARVLFIENAGRSVGFVVESLNSIEMADWHSKAETPAEDGSAIFRPLVLLGLGDQRRMVSHIDLFAEIAKFHHDKPLAHDLAMTETVRALAS